MPPDHNRISSDYRRALRGFAATVSIVSVRTAKGNAGITVTAVSSVSMEPPSLLVVVNAASSMHSSLVEASRFCINILGAEHVEHSRTFGTPMPMDERFEAGDWRLSADDVPYLCEAQANIFCEKAEAFTYGTHTVFVGRVYQLAIGDAICPLIYLNGRYLRLADEAPDAVRSGASRGVAAPAVVPVRA